MTKLQSFLLSDILTYDSTTKGTDNPEKTKYCLLINFERILHHASCTDET